MSMAAKKRGAIVPPPRERAPEPLLYKRAYRWRGSLAAVPVLAAALIGWHVRREPWLTWIPGTGLVAIGWTVRTWAQVHLGYRLRDRQQLVSCGPFSYVRNPIYLANGTMIVGSVLASGTIWLAPLALVWCAVLYSMVVRYEEWLLALHYGSPYIDYLGRALRWLPHRRKPAPHRLACRHDRLASAILAELHTPLILLPALVKWLVNYPPLA